jgi:hypothetical protein
MNEQLLAMSHALWVQSKSGEFPAGSKLKAVHVTDEGYTLEYEFKPEEPIKVLHIGPVKVS